MLTNSGTRFLAVLQRSLRLSLPFNSSNHAAASCTPTSPGHFFCTTIFASPCHTHRLTAVFLTAASASGLSVIQRNARQVVDSCRTQQLALRAYSSVSASDNAASTDGSSNTTTSASEEVEAPPPIHGKSGAGVSELVEKDLDQANVVSEAAPPSGSNSGESAAPNTSTTATADLTLDGAKRVDQREVDTEGGKNATSGSGAGRDEAPKNGKGSKKKFSQLPESERFDLADIRGYTFQKCLPRVLAAIKEADFVAFNLQYTGVRTAQWRQPMELDTKDTMYANKKHSAENFLVIQVGLCPFVWDAEAERFKVSPFMFHIFPRIKSSWAFSMAPSFFCEAASVKHLAQQKIHLSDAVETGISYLSVAQEEAYREVLLRRRLPEASQFEYADVQQLSPEDTTTLETNIKRVMQWHEEQSEAAKAGERPEKVLARDLNLLQRRVLIEAVHRLFPMLVPVTVHPHQGIAELGAGTEKAVRCHVEFSYTAHRGEKAALEAQITAQVLEAAEEDLNKTVGFKRVIDELAKGPAFLVGHDCLMDLLHFEDKFGTGLPPDMTAFCSALHAKLPLLFDTKHIIHSHTSAAPWAPLHSSLRSAMKKTNGEEVPVVKAEGFESLPQLPTVGQLNGNGKMNGGLDAFATGLLFARLAKGRGIHPGELRTLAQHVKKPWQPPVIRPGAEERSILREVLKRAEERAAEERSIDEGGNEASDEVGKNGDGDTEASPLQGFAKAANWVYAGAIRNARVSCNVANQGWLRACQAHLDPGVRVRLGPRRQNVLFLWDFPIELTDVQMRDAVRNLMSEDGTGKHYYVVRIDGQAALVMFPKLNVAREFWERAGARPGRLAGAGREVVLETEKGWQYKAKVDTFETFIALCESGVTAKDVRQAAIWLGLDPQHSFRKNYLAVQGRLYGNRKLAFGEEGDTSEEAKPSFGVMRKENREEREERQQSKRSYGVVEKETASQREEQPSRRSYGVIQKDALFSER